MEEPRRLFDRSKNPTGMNAMQQRIKMAVKRIIDRVNEF
jgi:hypothetical protein